MSTSEKYNRIFCEVLEIDENQLLKLKYRGTELWDSVGHMSLISSIEDNFDIMMETDDIIDFSSYEKGMELLTTNYGIKF